MMMMMMGTGISTTVTPIGVIVYDARAIIRTGVLAFTISASNLSLLASVSALAASAFASASIFFACASIFAASVCSRIRSVSLAASHHHHHHFRLLKS